MGQAESTALATNLATVAEQTFASLEPVTIAKLPEALRQVVVATSSTYQQSSDWQIDQTTLQLQSLFEQVTVTTTKSTDSQKVSWDCSLPKVADITRPYVISIEKDPFNFRTNVRGSSKALEDVLMGFGSEVCKGLASKPVPPDDEESPSHCA